MHGLWGLLFLLGGNPPALPATWHADLASIRHAAATLHTVQASFVQTRTLKMLNKPLVSRGLLAYRRPNDLRWEYQSPLGALLVVRAGNARRLLRYGTQWVSDTSAKLAAVTVVLGEVSLWLDGNFGASKTFRPKLRPATRDQPAHIELLPLDRSLGKIITRITITFGGRPGTISAIDIFDQGEGITHIAFADPRYNQAIPDERFATPR